MRRRQSERTLAPLRVLMTLETSSNTWRFGLDLARALVHRNVTFVFAALGPAPTQAQRQEAELLGDLVHLSLPDEEEDISDRQLADIASRIAEAATRFQVDLLHLNELRQAAHIDTEKPVVVMSHSCIPTLFHALRHIEPHQFVERHRTLNRQGILRADVVLAPSGSHANLMTATYGQIRNLRVVHYATGAAPPAINRPHREGIVAVGHWWDEAGNGAVLDDAAGRVSRRLTMIGERTGPKGQSLEIRNAYHAGPLSPGETLAHIGMAEVFVSPSLYEPFGQEALEAAACRTPLVLADIQTYRELWDGAALFVPPSEPGAFAEAIEKLLRERHLREILAQLASNRATRFTPVRQAAAVRAVYDSVSLPAMRETVG